MIREEEQATVLQNIQYIWKFNTRRYFVSEKSILAHIDENMPLKVLCAENVRQYQFGI